MKCRIAIGAGVGLLSAIGWALYFSSAFPSPSTRAEPIAWNLALFTPPIVLDIYWVLLANPVTYGFIGLIAETVRHKLHQAQ
jgi:hypothetical protein